MNQRDLSYLVFCAAMLLATALPFGLPGSKAAAADGKEREVVSGFKTKRLVPGEPYELLGKRIFFSNWYYVNPGDLGWQNDKGEDVYVKGDEGPWGAHYIGMDTPRGIHLVAEKPKVIGGIQRPVGVDRHRPGVANVGDLRLIYLRQQRRFHGKIELDRSAPALVTQWGHGQLGDLAEVGRLVDIAQEGGCVFESALHHDVLGDGGDVGLAPDLGSRPSGEDGVGKAMSLGDFLQVGSQSPLGDGLLEREGVLDTVQPAPGERLS